MFRFNYFIKIVQLYISIFFIQLYVTLKIFYLELNLKHLWSKSLFLKENGIPQQVTEIISD